MFTFYGRLIEPRVYRSEHITKTYLYNFDPLKPHFYIVKLGFTRYALFFIFLLKNIDCGYSLEPPRRGTNEQFFILIFGFKKNQMFSLFPLVKRMQIMQESVG